MFNIVNKAKSLAKNQGTLKNIIKEKNVSCKAKLHSTALVLMLVFTSIITFACGLELSTLQLYNTKPKEDLTLFETFNSIYKELTCIGMFSISAAAYNLLATAFFHWTLCLCCGDKEITPMSGSESYLLNVTTGLIFYLMSGELASTILNMRSSQLLGLFFIRTNYIGLFIYLTTVLLTIATSKFEKEKE